MDCCTVSTPTADFWFQVTVQSTGFTVKYWVEEMKLYAQAKHFAIEITDSRQKKTLAQQEFVAPAAEQAETGHGTVDVIPLIPGKLTSARSMRAYGANTDPLHTNQAGNDNEQDSSIVTTTNNNNAPTIAPEQAREPCPKKPREEVPFIHCHDDVAKSTVSRAFAYLDKLAFEAETVNGQPCN
ncbi:hypothetical protein Pelo_19308 [Pelomyxa schiedti]|nr:hypothetical protein Pelo_19308 [Pelomyxa schiedti]